MGWLIIREWVNVGWSDLGWMGCKWLIACGWGGVGVCWVVEK